MDTTFKPKDYAGQKFGMVTAIKRSGEKDPVDGSYIWVLRCDCGAKFKKCASRFARLYSCGCQKRANSGQSKPIDLRGFRNFMVSAVEPTDRRDPNGYIFWRLRCDCGNIFERPTYAMLRRTVKSCGCKAFMPKGRPRIPHNGSHVNQLFSNYRRAAKERGHDFRLSKNECRQFFESDCFYCGAKPTVRAINPNLSGVYPWNGIDRVDNAVGYIPSNCVACCGTCNRAKASTEVNAFLAWIKRVYEHNHASPKPRINS